MYTMTPGLLMSMAIKADNALAVPGFYDSTFSTLFGLPIDEKMSHKDSIIKGLKLAKETYRHLEKNISTNQIDQYNEVTGGGYYSPERESLYKNLIDQYLTDEELEKIIPEYFDRLKEENRVKLYEVRFSYTVIVAEKNETLAKKYVEKKCSDAGYESIFLDPDEISVAKQIKTKSDLPKVKGKITGQSWRDHSLPFGNNEDEQDIHYFIS